MSSSDPSQVDSATLLLSAGRDIEQCYRFLLEARATQAELERRLRCRAAPVMDLRAWRKARGLSINAAAELVGIGRSSWFKYEAEPALTPRYALLACQAVSAPAEARSEQAEGGR